MLREAQPDGGLAAGKSVAFVAVVAHACLRQRASLCLVRAPSMSWPMCHRGRTNISTMAAKRVMLIIVVCHALITREPG